MAFATGLNINTFYSNLKDTGVLLQNYWSITLSQVPVSDGKVETLQFYALDCQIPGITQNMNNISWLGKNFYVPGTFQHGQETTMLVRCDQYNTIRHKLLNWVDTISNHAHREEDFNAGAATMGGVKFQAATAEISVFSDKGQLTGEQPYSNPTASYRLYGFYPSSVEKIEMVNTADNIAVASFPCRFSFQYFDRII